MKSNWYRIKNREELMALPDFCGEVDGDLQFTKAYFNVKMFKISTPVKLEPAFVESFTYALVSSSVVQRRWYFRKDWVIPLSEEEARAAEILYGRI